MKNVTALRPRNGLFNFLLYFSGVSFVLVWLPLLRCLFDGSTYRWGQSFFGFSFHSRGIEPGLLFLLLALVFFLALFYSFYWVENRRVFHGLLIGWWLFSFGNLLFEFAMNGDVMFHGDTLDVHLSMAAIVTPIALLALILVVLAIRKDGKLPRGQVNWNRLNKRAAWIILAPLPIQILLLATGEPHGLTDEVGVVITIIQAILFPTIFLPKEKSAMQ